MTSTDPLKIVIAADAAMSRDVVRFFLQEDGFDVVGEAVRGDDAAWMAKRFQAEAVVLHFGIAWDEAQDAIGRIRRAAADSRIVVITPEGGTVPLPEASRGADAYIQEGVGLIDLAFVLRELCRSPMIAIDQDSVIRLPDPEPRPTPPPLEPVLASAALAPGEVAEAEPQPVAAHTSMRVVASESPAASPRSPRRTGIARPWRGRTGLVPLVAAAASFTMVLALTLYRSQLENLLYPPGSARLGGVEAQADPRVYVRASESRLDALVLSIRVSHVVQAPSLAQDLIEERQRAVDAGADVTSLDHEIVTALRPAVRQAPDGVAVAVLTVLAPVFDWAGQDLGDLIGGSEDTGPGTSTGGGGQVGAGDGTSTGADGTRSSGGAESGTGGRGGSGSGSGGGGDGGNGGGGGGDGGGNGGGDGGGDGGGGDGGGGGNGNCDQPGNGEGNGYGSCDGQGAGNDSSGSGSEGDGS